MNKHNKIKQKAFTIIETLVAISILTIALTGPLAIIAQALRSSYYARDQITAYYLAQEAIEYVRNMRDNNGLKGINALPSEQWLSNIAVDSANGTNLINPYGVAGESDQIKATLTRTPSGYALTQCVSGCLPLKFNPQFSETSPVFEALYGDSSSIINSIFTREVTFSEPPPYNNPADTTRISPTEREVIVTVRVKWNSPSGENVVSIREHLTNWQLEKTPPENI